MKRSIVTSRAQCSMLTRQSPFSARDILLERKDKKKKKRDDDDDDDDDDHVPSAPAKGGKGGKGGAAAAPAKGAEFDVKSAIVAFDAHVKKLVVDLAPIKIGKADPSILANVTFDGEPLIALAQIQVRDPQTLSVSPYDTSLVAKLVKTIQASDSTLVVNNDGKTILIPVPKPTPEHKRNLSKQAAQAAEKAKVEIRNSRRDLINGLKAYNLPKDDNKIAENQIQKAHDDHVKKVDAALKAKEQELAK